MKQNRAIYGMFKSATTRLTGWYLLMLMLMSLVFSVAIYNVATNEVQTRLERFQSSIQGTNPDSGLPLPSFPRAETIRANEQTGAEASLFERLILVNIIILVCGGVVSYFLARRSLEPLEKAHDVQSRFTSDASHELRTPLATMKTEIEVTLKDKNASTEELREVLSSNLEEVNKLTNLSEMLLKLSRMESDKLKMGPINLNKIIKDKISDFNQPSSRIALDKSLKQYIIYGDETAISDLVKIMIDNALQYSPSDSRVNIHLSKQDDHAKFEITNTGPGIEPDKIEHIFERFFRADSSRTNGDHRGYGLGLALAKNIVLHHNGRLFVKSTPGIETTFTFVLPLNNRSQAKTKIS